MKNSRAEAERWLKEAEVDLRIAKLLYNNEFYAAACFHSEQSAQKSLKSLLYLQGERFIFIHSIKKLVEECINFYPELKDLIVLGEKLDKYYIPTRYPDGLAFPAIPSEIYNKFDAEDAIKCAEEIFNITKSKLVPK